MLIKSRILAALVATLFVSAPAQAQEACLPRDQAAAWFKEQFGERSLGQGLTSDGRVMFELFTDNKGETWTLLMVLLRGQACVIAAGKDWCWRSPKVRKGPKA